MRLILASPITRIRPRQIKNRHGRREMPAPLFVDPLKIRMPQQARGSRKSSCFFGLHGEVPDSACAGQRPDLITQGRDERLDCGNGRRQKLLAEAGFYGDPLPSFSAAAGKHLLAALGLHARAKTMLLNSLAPVGLECTLGHEK